MNVYIDDVADAVFAFPFVALLLTVPYALVQYRRHGAVPYLSTVLFFSFVLYLLCAYFLVIFPLPDPDTVTAAGKQPQLRLFRWCATLVDKEGLVLGDPSTWLPALRSAPFVTTLFNVALTLPFGFYLRYFFKRRWWQALLGGFLLSLFFELTQLSGLYDIYPHPYRLFDVDDLFMNTLGTVFGYAATGPLERILPSVDVSVQKASDKASRASASKRLVGTLIDLSFVVLTLIALDFVIGAMGLASEDADLSWQPPLALALFMVVVPLANGRSLGQRIVRLNVVREDGSPAPRRLVALRGALCWLVIMPLPLYLIELGNLFFTGRDLRLYIGFEAAVFAVFLLFVGIRAVRSHWTGTFVMLHGKLTGTRIVAAETTAGGVGDAS